MATVTEQRLITATEFMAMVGDERCELVRGRIVPMPPPPNFNHGEIISNISYELRAFIEPRKLGRVTAGDVAVITGRDPDSVRGVDVLFISHEQYARRNPKMSALDVAPELMVEVLSPSNTMPAMLTKVEEYFAIGAKLVWIVDQENLCVFAYRSPIDVRKFTLGDELPGDDVLPGFSVPLSRLFM
jgi:Uma2 family endonuclease